MAQINESLYWLEVTSSGFALVWKIISSPLIFLLHVTFLKALSLNEEMKSERSRVTWWVVQGLWDQGLAPWGAKCSGTFFGSPPQPTPKKFGEKASHSLFKNWISDIELFILLEKSPWNECSIFSPFEADVSLSLSPSLSFSLSHAHTLSLSDATSSFSVELWNFYGLTLVARNRKVSSFFVVIAN